MEPNRSKKAKTSPAKQKNGEKVAGSPHNKSFDKINT